MLALIDGDVLVYRAGWASEKEQESIACIRANKMIEDMLHEVGATEYQVWLSDSLSNNFRMAFNPEYKANRKDQPKPKHYNSLRAFLTNEWEAQITQGQEADDALGIGQSTASARSRSETDSSRIYPRSIICSNDKDLLQVPGLHYNFVKKEHFEQTYFEGLREFYLQILVGDRVDNIVGVEGIGPVRGGRALQGCRTEAELFRTCQAFYKDEQRLYMNGLCLWVRREPGQIWKPPVEDKLPNQSGIKSNHPHGHSSGEETPDRGVLLGGGLDSE